MQLTKVMNTNMEVAMVEGMMIGKCRGPIKAILKKDEERINAILDTIRLEEEIVEEPVVETNVVDIYEGIDMDDYKLFCDWMIANGGTPSIEEYRQAIEYYSAI